MGAQPSTMRELIDAARDRHGVGITKLAGIARAGGHTLSHPALSRLYNGKADPTKVERDTIKALAWLANVTYQVARDAAGIAPGMRPFADEIPARFDELHAAERQLLINAGNLLLDARQKSATIAESQSQVPDNDDIVIADVRGLKRQDVHVIEDTDMGETDQG